MISAITTIIAWRRKSLSLSLALAMSSAALRLVDRLVGQGGDRRELGRVDGRAGPDEPVLASAAATSASATIMPRDAASSIRERAVS